MSDTIKNDDVVSRAALDPKDFSDEIPTRLDLDGHFQLTTGQNHKISVNCHRFLKTVPDDVHLLGLEKARIVNNRKKTDAVEQTYAGYMQATAATVQSITAEDHKLVIIHSPIKDHDVFPDNAAHCDITLIVDPPSDPKKAIKARFVERLKDIFERDYVSYTPPAANNNTSTNV